MARILIVEARFYAHLNDMLLDGARAAIEAAGHSHETITVPGALELPGAIALAAESGRYDAFVALGVVIRGETYHFEIVAGESARGLMALTLDGLAVGNGILTVENEAQAIVRADPTQANKGGDAAKAALAPCCELEDQRAVSLSLLAPATPRCAAAARGSSANCRRHIRARRSPSRRAWRASREGDLPAPRAVASVARPEKLTTATLRAGSSTSSTPSGGSGRSIGGRGRQA